MRQPRYLVIALLSLTLIALEVIWTRILSAAFFYTFGFLVLSLAILGLGLGALLARLFPRLVQGRATGVVLLASGSTALLAPAAVLHLGLDFATLLANPWMLARLALAVLLLALPFVLAGAALGRLFRDNVGDMPRLYMADLVGAAAGALGAVVAMNTLEVPRASVLAVLPMLLAGVLVLAPRRAAGRILGPLAAVALTAACAVWLPGWLRPERWDGRSFGPVVFERWDAMGRLRVHQLEEHRLLNIDNASVAPVYPFDGRFGPEALAKLELAEHVREMLGGKAGYVAMSLGAGGGRDVLQSLLEEASEVHAVEVNPAINELMTRGMLAEYSGRIYADPRVRVVTEDGRSYVRRFSETFDVILSYSSNSFAALASGAFALSENYLFTTEAFEDYLRALAPGGMLVMEHQFYIPRAVSEALEALRRTGVAHPEQHVAVYNLAKYRRMVLLVGRSPVTPAQVDALFGPLSEQKDEDLHLLWPPAAGHEDDLVAAVVRNGWRSVQPLSTTDLSPVSDDRPFAAQLGLMRNVSAAAMGKLSPIEYQGFPTAKLVLLAILAVVALIGLPLLALPRLARGARLGAGPAVYFGALGAAFMGVEVVLIQQMTLLVGASSYALVVVLLTLLCASGLGSRFAARTPTWLPFVAILGWIALDLLFYTAVVRVAGPMPLPARIAVVVLAVAPLGFFMGQPFPKGAAAAGERVDWGFAVNGVMSVLGSAAALLVAMSAGFSVALMAAGVVYAMAWAALELRGGWIALRAGEDGPDELHPEVGEPHPLHEQPVALAVGPEVGGDASVSA